MGFVAPLYLSAAMNEEDCQALLVTDFIHCRPRICRNYLVVECHDKKQASRGLKHLQELFGVPITTDKL